MPARFADRVDAGRRLAAELVDLRGVADVVVVGLPRGGVPVAAEVAAALGAPLDVLVVGKVGVPGHRELALAAVADDGTVVVNPAVVSAAHVDGDTLAELAGRRVAELARRGDDLRGGRRPLDLAGRTVVIVDDGMATGATMRVAVAVARHRGAAEVVAAVPVTAPDSAAAVRAEADRVVAVAAPPGFQAVGPWYRDFTQVGDDEVRALLR